MLRSIFLWLGSYYLLAELYKLLENKFMDILHMPLHQFLSLKQPFETNLNFK